ncbi:MAG: dihydrolipoamide acetyltransferase family protein [Anaerolineae bacterium]
MSVNVILPNLGFGMTEGRILAWLKQPGDVVRKGEILAEIESDKASVELEAVADGILDAILAPVDTVVAVDSVIAVIREQDAPSEPIGDKNDTHKVPPPEIKTGDSTPSRDAVQLSAPEGLRASPLAQRIAREMGINLSNVAGSGRGGRIMREDLASAVPMPSTAKSKPLAAPAVRKAARDLGVDLREVPPTGSLGQITHADLMNFVAARQAQAVSANQPSTSITPPAAERGLSAAVKNIPSLQPSPSAPVKPPEPAQARRIEVLMSTMRQTIARRLTQSAQEAPHFYTQGEFDFTKALKSLPHNASINALILYLTVQALKAVPELNATYEQDSRGEWRLYRYHKVDLSVAVALDNGLITPTLPNADDYSLIGLAERAKALIERTRSGKMRPEDMTPGTFTVSNLGVIKQVERFTAILNPPQVGILAVGAVKARPVVVDGGLHIREMAYLSLSADHRVIDGVVAGRFLAAFEAALQSFAG